MYLYILYLLYLYVFIAVHTCSLFRKAFREAFRKGYRNGFRKGSRGGPSAQRRHDPLCAAAAALCHCRSGKSYGTLSRKSYGINSWNELWK